MDKDSIILQQEAIILDLQAKIDRLENHMDNTPAAYRFRGFYIPVRMIDSLEHYIKKHEAPGDFLRCVICNDLRGSCDRADDENQRNIVAYMAYLYNHAPISCWGSKEIYERWINETK